MNYRFFTVEGNDLLNVVTSHYKEFEVIESLRKMILKSLDIDKYIEENGEILAVMFTGEIPPGWKPYKNPPYYCPDESSEDGQVMRHTLASMVRPKLDEFRSLINSQAIIEGKNVYFASLKRLGDKWAVNVPEDAQNRYIPVPGLRELSNEEVSEIRSKPNSLAV